MNTSRTLITLAGTILVISVCVALAQTPPRNAAGGLADTSWQLVKIQGGDDTTLTPDDGANYTIAFHADGTVSARIDCNRGRGRWKSFGPNRLELSPLALTRAMCPPGSLHDHIVKHWQHIRSYVIRDGHLFLSLMADGGIYEFESMRKAQPAALKSQKTVPRRTSSSLPGRSPAVSP